MSDLAITAARFFYQWYDWASNNKLTPMIAKAKMLKPLLPGIIDYIKHVLTNAKREEATARSF